MFTLPQDTVTFQLDHEDASEGQQRQDDADAATIFDQIARHQRRLNRMRERTAQELPWAAGDILFL